MTQRARELYLERGQLIEQMRSIQGNAEKEKRNLTAEESQEYDRIDAEQEALGDRIEREQRLADVELEHRSAKRPGEGDADAKPSDNERAQLDAFEKYLTRGLRGMSDAEIRNLQAGNLTEGGSFVPPMQWIDKLIKAIDDKVIIRQKASKFTIGKSESLGVPVLDADPADFDWTTELATGSEDSSMKTGRREFVPSPFAKRIKISRKLIQSSAIPVPELVKQRLAYKAAITEEKGYMTGNGVNQALGLFTAHANGIPTSRDVQTGSSTSITPDALFDAQETLKDGYQANAEWLFHRSVFKVIRKLKDSTNQYLWQPGLQQGYPDSLLGRPVNRSEYAPSTLTTGLYVGMYADFSYYWIVDALDLTVQVLNELYAETNQVGYILRKESDGTPVLAEAFVRLITN